jgi:hypothetical protein
VLARSVRSYPQNVIVQALDPAINGYASLVQKDHDSSMIKKHWRSIVQAEKFCHSFMNNLFAVTLVGGKLHRTRVG